MPTADVGERMATSQDQPTDPVWDDLPNKCPECGEDTYLAARLMDHHEQDGKRVVDKAELVCGEHTYNVPMEGPTKGMRGCGHIWLWERDG